MLFDDNYFEIEKPTTGIFKDKGSKFIACTFPVFSESEIKMHLENLRKEYFDARHHCYAWVMNPDKSAQRANDDGEPAGTAGKPILNQILSQNLTNVLVVVIRYFGGTKLGVPGLINAYKSATKDAFSQVIVKERFIYDFYQISFEYSMMNSVMRLIEEEDLLIKDQKFEISCIVQVGVRKSKIEKVTSKLKTLYELKYEYLYTH